MKHRMPFLRPPLIRRFLPVLWQLRRRPVQMTVSSTKAVCVPVRYLKRKAVLSYSVNPGGRIIAGGSVIILGSLRGNVFAGAGGNEDCFVVALEMNPMQIKIGEVIARSSDSAPRKKSKGIAPKIAYVDDSNIYIEDLGPDVFEDIRINC